MNYANKLISKACDTKFLGIYTYALHCIGKFMLNKLHTN